MFARSAKFNCAMLSSTLCKAIRMQALLDAVQSHSARVVLQLSFPRSRAKASHTYFPGDVFFFGRLGSTAVCLLAQFPVKELCSGAMVLESNPVHGDVNRAIDRPQLG